MNSADLLIEALRETAATEQRVAAHLLLVAKHLTRGEISVQDAADALTELANIIRDGSCRLAEFLP